MDDSFISIKTNGPTGTAIAFIWCGVLPMLGLFWLFGWLK